ncbi:MAG: flagellar motor switch phosphatase FliY [Desulfitobacteriaceae bacterium]
MGNGMLSQEEIDALLRGTLEPDPPAAEELGAVEFSDMEKDAVGEIANISMGTAATTLSLLLGKKVEITTPKVDVATSEQIRKEYPIPSVVCDVRYKAGIEGSNLLILSQRDGAVIVDLMMGGDGKNPTAELSELQISGISEAMNQMMGSAATSMSTMFNSMVDITPPKLVLHNLAEEEDIFHEFLQAEEPFVRISFRMVVESVIDSILVQVVPLSVAKRMVGKLLGGVNISSPSAATAEVSSPNVSGNMPTQDYGYPPQNMPYGVPPSNAPYGAPPPGNPYGAPQGGYGGSNYGTPPYGALAYGAQQSYGLPPYGGSNAPPPGMGYPPNPPSPTSVQPAQFAPLHPGQALVQPNNLGLILDVPLQVSVELGKAKKTIKEILEMGPGSVIELDRLAGEPVDMIVNGKLVAKCEVVVINETFGIRITDIIHPIERMQSLN